MLKSRLDGERLRVLSDLVKFSKRFIQNVRVHRMDVRALAVVLAPNVFPDPEVSADGKLLGDPKGE